MNKLIALTLASILLVFSATAQKISYSEPDRDDSKRTDFDIIGKVGGNYLIFKNNRNSDAIGVYNGDMKLLEKIDINKERQKWINVDFIPYADEAWMIYQYQQKSILYCMAVKIDGNGKMLTSPWSWIQAGSASRQTIKFILPSTATTRKRSWCFKINSKNSKNFIFTTILFDEQLQEKDRRI